ncbi:isoprenylcysteine carboxylmethyltransferase family protein [Streptococcus sp. 27098_8_134]|uniref:methyltransferase family protein n=1 Tax=Streptococcus sp. 27098_8_134 TaxID=3003644 RepID=UPI00352DE510
MNLQTVFIYIFFVIFISTEMWIKNKTKSNNVNDSADKGSRYIIIGSVICCLFLINGQFLDFVPHLPSLTIYLGILISLAGFALRIYAVNYLGKNFTLAVQTTDSQQLVDHGPYAIVRNPAYTGSILSILGLSITSLNPLTIIISLILLVVGYSIRLRVEEKALGNHFGKNYEAYCQKVRYRVFPYIW